MAAEPCSKRWGKNLSHSTGLCVQERKCVLLAGIWEATPSPMLPADIYWGLIGKSQLHPGPLWSHSHQVICVQVSLDSSDLPEPLNSSTHDFYSAWIYMCKIWTHLQIRGHKEMYFKAMLWYTYKFTIIKNERKLAFYWDGLACSIHFIFII